MSEEKAAEEKVSEDKPRRCWWCALDALDGHLTCGQVTCSENSARIEYEAMQMTVNRAADHMRGVADRVRASLTPKEQAVLDLRMRGLSTIDDLIDRSSLGTPEAKALRALAPKAVVDGVLSRMDELDAAEPVKKPAIEETSEFESSEDIFGDGESMSDEETVDVVADIESIVQGLVPLYVSRPNTPLRKIGMIQPQPGDRHAPSCASTTGVYFSIESDNFYCVTCRVGCGDEFHAEHRMRVFRYLASAAFPLSGDELEEHEARKLLGLTVPGKAATRTHERDISEILEVPPPHSSEVLEKMKNIVKERAARFAPRCTWCSKPAALGHFTCGGADCSEEEALGNASLVLAALSNDVRWRGIKKLQEEMGELAQELAKLSVCPDGKHWDNAEKGPLIQRVEDELGDVMAAIDYFVTEAERDESLDIRKINRRRVEKYKKFEQLELDGIPLQHVPFEPIVREVVKQAVLIGKHWGDQEGVNAGEIDKLAFLTKSLGMKER